MLGRDRTAGSGDEVVDEGGDRQSLILDPACRGIRRRADVEMHVAVAKMAERDDAGAGKATLHLRGRLDHEARHGGNLHRNIVLADRTALLLALRNAVTASPEGLGRTLTGRA